VSYCTLQQRPDGRWWCPVCDPAQKRLLPVPARRHCDRRLAAASVGPSPTEVLIAAARSAKSRRPGDAACDDEIRRRVAICGECPLFVPQCPACEERLDAATSCELTRRLAERVVRGSCKKWMAPVPE